MGIILTILAVTTFAYYWYTQNIRIHALKKRRVKKAKPKAKPKQEMKEKPAFRCVVIKPGESACQSAQNLKNQSILMTEATALPLDSCNASQCDCRYSRFDDRRRDTRRGSSLITEGAIQHNKRAAKQERRLKPSQTV